MESTTATSSSDAGALRERRRALGLTQVDLARAAGCSVSYIRLLEVGCVPARSRVLPAVWKALGCESSAIFPVNDEGPGHHSGPLVTTSPGTSGRCEQSG